MGKQRRYKKATIERAIRRWTKAHSYDWRDAIFYDRAEWDAQCGGKARFPADFVLITDSSDLYDLFVPLGTDDFMAFEAEMERYNLCIELIDFTTISFEWIDTYKPLIIGLG